MLREVLINSMNGVYASKITNACVSKLSNSGAITCACCLGIENCESHIHSSRVNQRLPKEVLINSMNATYASKITNTGVSKLSNSGAITYAYRLGVGDFESHIHSFRVNQHLPKGEAYL